MLVWTTLLTYVIANLFSILLAVELELLLSISFFNPDGDLIEDSLVSI